MTLPETIELSQNAAESINQYLAQHQYSKVAVLVDDNTRAHCYPRVQAALGEHLLVEIKAGEEEKHLSTCTHIWQVLTDAAFDRKGVLINLGGGVIGDMGGFCAAAYKRGIDFVNLPTTLLSQVDASVGGKLGIDFQGFKNHIGFFREPNRVIIAPEFLQTLPDRELRSGFAEVIKHCLIADSAYWELIKQQNYEGQDWSTIIPRSVATKYSVVTEDPTERGVRKILNFGHTIGHALESFYLDRGEDRLFHGEAIAIGMITEGYLSVKKCGLSQESFEDLQAYIQENYPHYPVATEDVRNIAQLSLQDKKNSGGSINASLLDKCGHCLYDIAISLEEIEEAIGYYINK